MTSGIFGWLQDSKDYDEIILFPHDPASRTLLVLSILASSTLLIFCLAYKLYRRPLEFLVTWIMLPHFLASFTTFLFGFPFPKTILVCKIGMVIELFCDSSAFLWSAFFGHALLTTIKSQRLETIDGFKLRYFLFGTVAPLLYSFVNFFQYWVESSNDVCVYHIPRQGSGKTLFVLTTIPLYILFGLCLWWYSRAIMRTRTHLEKEYKSQALVLLMYPGILIICWLPELVFNMLIYMQIVPNSSIFAVVKNLDYIQGLLESAIYGISRNMFRVVREYFRKCICLNRAREELLDGSLLMRSEEQAKLNESLINRQIKRVESKHYAKLEIHY